MKKGRRWPNENNNVNVLEDSFIAESVNRKYRRRYQTTFRPSCQTTLDAPKETNKSEGTRLVRGISTIVVHNGACHSGKIALKINKILQLQISNVNNNQKSMVIICLPCTISTPTLANFSFGAHPHYRSSRDPAVFDSTFCYC